LSTEADGGALKGFTCLSEPSFSQSCCRRGPWTPFGGLGLGLGWPGLCLGLGNAGLGLGLEEKVLDLGALGSRPRPRPF